MEITLRYIHYGDVDPLPPSSLHLLIFQLLLLLPHPPTPPPPSSSLFLFPPLPPHTFSLVFFQVSDLLHLIDLLTQDEKVAQCFTRDHKLSARAATTVKVTQLTSGQEGRLEGEEESW